VGTAHDANERASLDVLINGLKGCQAKIAKRESEIPAAQYWSEGITLTFQGHQYRVVSELGRGSYGASYKVVEARRDGQDGASYVGKVAFDKEAATQMMAAYQSARPVISGDHLATLYQFTEEWLSHNFIALLKYVDGSSINEWRGVIELLADEAGTPAMALVQDWIGQALDGLNNLHSSGYIHGDVSPRNIIVNNRNELVLTDYDLVTRVDSRLYSAGTTIYSAPENVQGQPAQCSHDIYALGASIFEVVFDRDPFMRDGTRDKARGLYWDTIDRSAWGWLPEFIDRATAPVPQDRFVDAKDVLDWILTQSLPAPVVPPAVDQPTVTGELSALVDVDIVETGAPRLAPTSNFSQQEVPWLGELLSTYPASLRGNIETRGLDSPFARQTYVATQLDRQVLQDVKGRKAQLIILCGNAGDGKTAFLQNLAKALGLPERSSAERIWDATLTDGLRVKFNLDGAASYNGQSADSLVDELLKPFLNGRARDERAHFLAINNGRLLEWIENNGQNTSYLTNNINQ
jgi:serine/threonine protein kinase